MVFAAAGVQVILYDVNSEQVNNLLYTIKF